MGRRSSRDADGTTGTTGTAGTPGTDAGSSTGDGDGDEGATGTATGLLRWGAGRLGSSPELAAPFVLAALAVTAAEAGITTVRTDLGGIPRFALWVPPVYLGSILVGLIGLGAVFLAAADARADRDRSHGRRLRVATGRLPSMLAVGAIGGIPVVGGLFAFLVPGVYFMLKFALALPAAAVDDLGPAAALRRSFVTTDGRLVRVSALLGSFALAVVVSGVAVTLLVGGTGTPFLGPLVQNLVTAVLLAVYGLAFGRMYPVSGRSRS